MKYTVLTFGCQMNISDSERIHTVMKSAGFSYESKMENTDLIVMNTCSVKQKAEDKVWGHFNKIKHLKRKNKNLRVGLTGCMVRESGVSRQYESGLISKDKLFQSSEFLDFVFRIEDLPRVNSYLSIIYDKQLGEDFSDELTSYFQVRPEYAQSFQVFVPVQTGCNKFCTYCIVPFTRKREISRPMEEIVAEVKLLAEQGAREVTLLGQTVNSYTHPESSKEYSENNFAELLYHINKIPGIARIRYTSPHPMDMNSELIRAHVELEKVCNHVHLPAQSGDTEVLKRMNRKYTRERYMEVIREVKEKIPDVGITTDIIVGFCSETEEEFQRTSDMFKEVEFDMSFTSRYSSRKGTYSDKNLPDDVPSSVKAERWHHLNDLMISILVEKNKQLIGRQYPILVERILPDGRFEGMTTNYKRVQFQSKKKDIIGKIIAVQITHTEPFVLLGKTIY